MFICIDGCIGVGKTTVATMLASEIAGASLLLENFEKHPFLSDFYTDQKYTFETELNFLLIHYHQIIKWLDNNPDIVISDFSLYKDMMFAEANLNNPDELRLFSDLYRYLLNKVPIPDKIICLSADTELIYKRILQRNRQVEKNITYDYIQKINEYYEVLFNEFKQNGISTIRVDMNQNDFVANPRLIDKLVEKL